MHYTSDLPPQTSPLGEPEPAERPYPRAMIALVMVLAFAIIGAWTFYTQAGVSGKADAIGYAVCHRIGERSFSAFGRQLPLCARCTGIYLGAMTALGVYIASGRGRAGRLPHWRVLGFLGLFVLILAIDGVNSYFNLFPDYDGPYEPRNWLRLTTGVFTGLTLTTIVLPIFNQSIWRDYGQARAPLANLKEAAGLVLLGGIAVLLTLSQNATILLWVGLVSAFGVLIILTLLMTVLFTTTTGRIQTYTRWKALALPLLAGLTLAISMIGVINWLRYSFTGTWDGFVF